MLMTKLIGFTCGAFDLCHPGHTQMFEYCKKHCDTLIVGIQTDPSIDRTNKAPPLEPLHIRALRLYQNKDVDVVIPYNFETDLLELLKLLNIDIRFLDDSYKGKEFTGRSLAEIDKLHDLHYTPRKHLLSSSFLRLKISGCK